MIERLAAFIKRHQVILGILAFLISTGPNIIQTWWGFFHNEPFITWLAPHLPKVAMDLISYVWILQVLGGVGLAAVIVNSFFGTGKNHSKKIPHAEYKEDTYQELLWVWDYDGNGQITNLVARLP